MSAESNPLEEDGHMPSHKVVLDVVDACGCTEAEALNLLQVRTLTNAFVYLTLG
jgi:hypothetical protein